jgi:large repetitive protein
MLAVPFDIVLFVCRNPVMWTSALLQPSLLRLQKMGMNMSRRGFKTLGLWQGIAALMLLCSSFSVGAAEDWQRTVIYMYGQTVSGQDMFFRGGIDWGYAKNNLGRDCAADKWLCAIPIRHRLFLQDPTRSNDKYLDWYGAETNQGNVQGSPLVWTTDAWPATWGTAPTVEKNGYGVDPENKWGMHYWKLDIDMDCSKTVNGWFELKSYISNGPAWESNIAQTGTPYPTINHMGRCGYVNVFKRSDNAVVAMNALTVPITHGLMKRAALSPLAFPASGEVGGSNYQVKDAFPTLSNFKELVFVTHDGVGNDLYAVEKAGMIWKFPNSETAADAQKTKILDLSAKVLNNHERGMLGLAFDPNFATNRYFYVYYIAKSNGDAVISRFKLSNDPLVKTEASEKVLFTQWQPGYEHKGGMLAFGPDGMLYVSFGDGGFKNDPPNQSYGQNLGVRLGTIHRVKTTDAGFETPLDNPFYGRTDAPIWETWAYGFRNPWRFSFDRLTGDLWVGDVGQDGWEEVNIVTKGGNYGWPKCEGAYNYGTTNACSLTSAKNPVHQYSHFGQARSVTGGYVYRGSALPELAGKYIFAEYVTGSVWGLDKANNFAQQNIATYTGGGGIAAFGEDRSGELYMVGYNEASPDSRIYKLVKSNLPAAFPQQLSQTKLFSNTAALTPASGVIEYNINVPQWADGAVRRHWAAVPDGKKITFSAKGNWDFPVGTAIVKHSEMPQASGPNKRLDTAVLLRQADRWIGFTYRWNDQQTDAEIVVNGSDIQVPALSNGETVSRAWHLNAPSECMGCHTETSGRVIALEARQLNRNFPYTAMIDNQLRSWNFIGLFDKDIGAHTQYEAFAETQDGSKSVTARARAYLDVNCAMCHSNNNSGMDFRVDTLIDDMNIAWVPSSPGTHRLKPLEPDSSGILLRLDSEQGYRMPKGSRVRDPQGVAVIRDWIAGGVGNATLQSISVTASQPNLVPDEQTTLQIIGQYSNGKSKAPAERIAWVSSNPDVINAEGKAGSSITVQALAIGQATLTATAESGATAIVNLKVVDANDVISLQIQPLQADIKKGTPRQFVAVATLANGKEVGVTTTATWQASSAPFSVTAQGLVSSSGQGNGSISAGYAGLSAQATVSSLGSGIRYYFKKPASWASVCIFAWQDGFAPLRGAWPGTRLNNPVDSWYNATFNDGEVNPANGTLKFIFNNCGQPQTGNLSRATEGWFDGSTNTWSDAKPGTVTATHNLVLLNATAPGNGTFTAGTTVTVTANPAPSGQVFAAWSGSGAAYLASAQDNGTATLVMPAKDISLSATYKLPYDPEGQALYLAKCASCHGAHGEGGVGKALTSLTTCPSCTTELLARKIELDMPPPPLFNPADCDASCATKVAGYILAEFMGSGQSCNASALPPSPRALRLLTPREYDNTVRDLLKLASTNNIAATFPQPIRVHGFDNNASVAVVSESHLDAYMNAAKTLSTQVDPANLVDATCRQTTSCIVQEIGKRAFRRPLTAAEVTRYSNIATTYSRAELLRALLASPYFLYRSEMGAAQADGSYKLTPYETATLLSYSFWETMPDDTLLNAAANGALNTAEGIRTQAQRLLSDARARKAVENFAAQWLGVTEIANISKSNAIFTPVIKEGLLRETKDFIAHVVFDGTRQYRELVTANYTFADNALGSFYGLTNATSNNFTQVGYGDIPRAGLLGHGSILATTAGNTEPNPVKRGLFVRKRLLCQELPDPPADVMATFPEVDPTKTLKERFALHRQSGTSCHDCHQYIDGIGFGFQVFDELGRYRLTENGFPIDTSGDMNNLEGLGLAETHAPFNSIPELGNIIADSKSGKHCYVTNYFRFTKGHSERREDSCTVDALTKNLVNGSTDLYQLMIDFTQTSNYTVRK